MTRMQFHGDNHAPGVPVFLVTGFLGSGKTTLLRSLISQPGMANSALIINEFGEIGLDHLLVESSFDNILMLDNGCVCCSIRGDLVDTIGDLFAKQATGEIPSFSRILIETTGLADPSPIVRDLAEAMSLRGRCSLRRVVVTIDGVLGPAQLRDTHEVGAQIAQADLCLITKTDIAGRNEVDVLLADLRSISPALDIRTVSHGNIDAAIVFAEDDTLNALPRAAEPYHARHAHSHDGKYPQLIGKPSSFRGRKLVVAARSSAGLGAPARLVDDGVLAARAAYFAHEGHFLARRKRQAGRHACRCRPGERPGDA